MTPQTLPHVPSCLILWDAPKTKRPQVTGQLVSVPVPWASYPPLQHVAEPAAAVCQGPCCVSGIQKGFLPLRDSHSHRLMLEGESRVEKVVGPPGLRCHQQQTDRSAHSSCRGMAPGAAREEGQVRDEGCFSPLPVLAWNAKESEKSALKPGLLDGDEGGR